MEAFSETGDIYRVKTEQFEGPFELLLSLIEKRKLFINDISLANIADDYVLLIKESPDFPKAQVTAFILIASTLILLKSRSLLPDIPLTVEEEEDINDLQNRLLLYQRMKELSLIVDSFFHGRTIYPPRRSKERSVYFSPDKDTTLPELFRAMGSVLSSLPAKNVLPQAAVKNVIHLEEVIERLTKKIQSVLKMTFREFYGMDTAQEQEMKNGIIVSFIALLELVKVGSISVTQSDTYGDIIMEAQNFDVPRYNNVQ